MAMLRKLAKAGIAAKLINEARKPQNQARIKQLIASLRAKAPRRA